MHTRHLVDPELVQFLDSIPRFDFTPESLPEIRRAAVDTPPLHAPEASGVTCEEVFIPSRDGAPPVRALVYRPTSVKAGERVPAVLHAHGGGYVSWKPEIRPATRPTLALWNRVIAVSRFRDPRARVTEHWPEKQRLWPVW
jgi:acetyl esterase/lipase